MAAIMRALIRRFATALLAILLVGIVVPVFAEWVIEVVRDKGGYNNAGQTFDWVLSVIRQFVMSGWVLGPVVFLAGLVSGLWVDALLTRLKPKPAKSQNPTKTPLKVPTVSAIPASQLNSPQPIKTPPEVPDSKKADFITDLFPMLQEFSDRDVDAFGNRTADWRESFVHGLSREWIDNAYAELRALSAKFSEVRPAFEKHKFYTDIYVMDDAIAKRLNALGEALQPARNVAEALSYNFDKRSVELVEDDMDKFRLAIGHLRTYVTQECLSKLTAMRKEALGSV
jgi:hypothetical protein